MRGQLFTRESEILNFRRHPRKKEERKKEEARKKEEGSGGEGLL